MAEKKSETDEKLWQWSEQKFTWVVGDDEEQEEQKQKPITPPDNSSVIDMYAFNTSGMQNLTEVREASERISIINIPYYGRIHFVKHMPGWIHLSIIVLYWLYGNWSAFTYILIPYISELLISSVFMWGKYETISTCIFIYFGIPHMFMLI